MLRRDRFLPLLLLWPLGCFEDPPDAGSPGTTSGPATSGDDTREPTTAEVTSDGSSFGGTGSSSDGVATGSTTGEGTSGATTAATGDATTAATGSTGEPPSPLCGCPPGDYVFCEGFEVFENNMFENWQVPSQGLGPMQVPGLCGAAFRGEIGAQDSFAVLSRQILDVLDDGSNDVIRLSGLMRIHPGCAENTPHRLVSARTDVGVSNPVYSAELDLDGDSFVLRQVPPPQSQPAETVLGDAAIDTWLPFSIALRGLLGDGDPVVEVRVGPHMTAVVRPMLPIDALSFTAVPGPFAFIDADQAGCTVDFDEVAVEALPPPPP